MRHYGAVLTGSMLELLQAAKTADELLDHPWLVQGETMGRGGSVIERKLT